MKIKKRSNEVALGKQEAGAGAISRDSDGANQANAAPKTAKRKKKAKKNAGDNAGAKEQSEGVEGTGSVSDDAYSDSSTISKASGTTIVKIVRKVRRMIQILLKPLMSLHLKMLIKELETVLI